MARVIDTNLTAAFLCTRAAFAVMKRSGGGRIINIGSISAQRVRPNSAAYSASKFGLVGLTHVVALEGREYGIACGCIHPGNTMVERRAATGANEDDEPMMDIAAVADLVVHAASQPAHVNILDAIVMPVGQDYIGRG